MALSDIFRSRFLRLLTILVVALTGILGGLLASARRAQPTPACIMFNRAGSSDLFQLNVGTGGVGLYRPGFDTEFAHHTAVDSVQFSPDGRRFTHYDYQAGILQVGSADTHKLHVIERNKFPPFGGYDWSPDGNTLAYILQDSSYGKPGDATLVLANPDNNQKRTLYLGAYPMDQVYLAGWSPDGEYLALGSGTFLYSGISNVGQYRFVSLRDGKIMPTTITALFATMFAGEGPSEVNQPVWSPQGHDFAYVTPGPTNFMLVIATPEGGTRQTLPLRTGSSAFISELHWSPDGRFAEVAAYISEDDNYDSAWHDDGYWHVYFLGMDGTALPDVLQENLMGFESTVSEGWWSADGRAWVFWHSFRIQGLDEDYPIEFSYLMAYYSDERRFEVLASDVSGGVFPLPVANGKAFVVQIDLNNASQKILLVTTDGKKPVTILEDAHGMIWDDLFTWDSVGGIAMRWYTGDYQPGYQQTERQIAWAWVDGSGRQNLTQESFESDNQNGATPGIEVVPSPTRQTVAAIFADGPEQGTIALLSPGGGQAIRIWHGKRGYFDNPIWSPDGSMLAFFEHADKPAIHILAADGSLLNLVASARADVTLIGWSWCM